MSVTFYDLTKEEDQDQRETMMESFMDSVDELLDELFDLTTAINYRLGRSQNDNFI